MCILGAGGFEPLLVKSWGVRNRSFNMPKRRRYRSNVFHPKVKKPLSFELTRRGRKQLDAAMRRGEVSLGDLVEYFLNEIGDDISLERIQQTAEEVAEINA